MYEHVLYACKTEWKNGKKGCVCQYKGRQSFYFLLSIYLIRNTNILQYFKNESLENSNYTNQVCPVRLNYLVMQ